MRLRQGLAVIPADDQLMIVGGPKRHTFRGKVAPVVFANLLALLDGTRDEHTLCVESGLHPEELKVALGLLEARALLDKSDFATPSNFSEMSRKAGDSSPDRSPQAISYLARQVSPNSGYPKTADLLDVLAAAAVHVTGDARFGELVCADLKYSGIGLATTGPDFPTDAPTLVVALDTVLEQALGWCEPRAIPVLRVASYERHVEIGPRFPANCVDCLCRSRSEETWGGDPGKDPEIAAALAASQTLAIVAQLPTMLRARTITRISLDGGSTETRVLLPYQDCAECVGDLPHVDHDTELVEALELLESEGRIGLGPLKELTGLEVDALRKLESRRPDFPTHPRVPLDAFNNGPIADLMRKVAGFRDIDERQRWAPSGGNLASVELYLVTTRLSEHTVFRYDDVKDELIVMHPDAISPAEALAGTDLAAADADTVFIFIAARDRIAIKYLDFAFRLSLLDAGCATTQFAAVASHHGLTVEFASEWDERLPNLLGLDNDGQFVTAIATIRNDGGTLCH